MARRPMNGGSGMGLRVPRSILLIDTDSLKLLRNFAKEVMERTICEDMSRYEKVSEQILYRVDALLLLMFRPKFLPVFC
jgi:hypothetical protein